jgi:hypothetical protein
MDSRTSPTPRPWRELVPAPLLAAVASVALAVGCVLVGYEPVGGDPDCLYRPIKVELARALRQGTLPFWSDRFGLGAPLVAESHAAAFYPPNWLLYGALGMSRAYRLELWLHFVALALATYYYARALGLTAWGGALAAVAMALGGFPMSHASHEPFYVLLPYLPLALGLAERYMAAGGAWRLAALALALGVQLAAGHFQIQAWTLGLVVLTGVWRVAAGSSPWRRAAGLVAAAAWAVAVAAAQLGLTWELTRASGFDRPIEFLSIYAFPPAHWAQLVLPRLFGDVGGGYLSPYWEARASTPDEATLYVGSVALVFAAVGLLVRKDRALAPWRWLAALGFALATMPGWFPEGYGALLHLPVLGHFRAPGRYTLLTDLGLCLLAGRGFDRAVPSRRFWAGFALAALVGAAATAWGAAWSSRPDVLEPLGGGARAFLLAEGAGSFAVGLAAVAVWRRASGSSPTSTSAVGRAAAWLPLLLAAAELTYLFHRGTTPWGWSVRFPGSSPVFQRLLRERGVALVAGDLQNVPVRAGLATAYPNLGIFPPPPNYLLEPFRFPTPPRLDALNMSQRFGITHGVFLGPRPFRPSEGLFLGEDQALDAMLPPKHDTPRPRQWRLERYPAPFPEARVARVSHVVADWYKMLPALEGTGDPDQVWFLHKDRPPDPPGPRARTARVVRWDGRSGEVEHDGTVDLVLRRTYYPGWTALLNDGVEVPVVPADGGFQAICIPGAGRTRVTIRYRPTRLAPLLAVSLAATAAAGLVLLTSARGRRPGYLLASGAGVG